MEKGKLVIKNGSLNKLLMFQDTVEDKLFVYGLDGFDAFTEFVMDSWRAGKDVYLPKSEFKRRLD